MSVDAAEALLAYALSAKGKWPLPTEAPIITRLNTWAAILDGDADVVARVAGWNQRRRYRVDSLGERIADAWAAYLFGEDPAFAPAADGDVANLEDLIAANELPSELERGAAMCSGEGEIWPRVYVDETVAPHALIEWVSRRNVLPLWVGARLAAAAVVTELGKTDRDGSGQVWRHFEVHAPGVLVNALFLGKGDNLGTRRPLEEHPATAELEEVWEHGLPGMLLGRVPNRIRRDRRLGVSDFAGILDTLLDLNEASVIGAHNARLTARKRVIVSATVLQGQAGQGDGDLTPEENVGGQARPPAARFDPDEEVLVEDPLDRELGREGQAPFRVLEYSFDAAALIEYKRDLVETALSRVGLTPQYVGAGVSSAEGYAISGTALRLRLIPTDKTGRAKARYWEDAVPKVLRTMARLDALSTDLGGLGRQWTNTNDLPTMERRPGLPEDELEEATKHATLVGSGVESIETAVRKLNPDRDDAWVDEEVARIRADKQAAGASSLPFGA